MNCHSNAYMASWSTWNTSRASSWVHSDHTGPAVSRHHWSCGPTLSHSEPSLLPTSSLCTSSRQGNHPTEDCQWCFSEDNWSIPQSLPVLWTHLWKSILGILLRFCVHRVALAWDMKKSFLMISIDPRDRLFEIPVDLKHCWGHAWDYHVQVYPNFFRVKSSPFLLNATINHHIEQYWTVDPEFVDKFLPSVYVDDVSICVDSVESTYQLYLESKLEAGFTLRKFITNSRELWHRIQLNKHTSRSIGTESPERDESYICYVFSSWPQYR